MAGNRFDLYLHPPWPLSPPLSAPLQVPSPPPNSAADCSAGSAVTAAIFPGGAPGTRTTSWSPSSCCSRPRSCGSRRIITAFSRAIRPSRPWPAPSRHGAGELGRARLLPARRQSAPAGPGSRARPRGRDPGRSGGAGSASRHRPIHGGRRRQLRLRAGHAGHRHERRPGHPPGIPPAPAPAGRRAHPLGDGAAIIPRRRGAAAWAFNQAIMELGALVCTARIAKCGECPVRSACATGRRG